MKGKVWSAPSARPYLGLALIGLPLLAWVLLRPRGVAVEVAGQRWVRQIEIERQVLEMNSEPCAQMPAGAREIGRRSVDGTEHCRFEAPAWRKRRVALAQGEAGPPQWPALSLADGERAGQRHAWQLILLRDGDGRTWECQLPLALWQSWPAGTRTRLEVHRFTGVADCGSLPR